LKYLLVALISILLALMGQIVWRYRLREVSLDLDEILSMKMLTVIFDPLIVLGIVFYAISTVLWFIALSHEELSKIYPLISINFALVALLGYVLLHEHIGLIRALGIALIVVGVIMVART